MKHTALITGASGGIGLEFARIFASKNYDLVLIARNKEKLQKLAGEIKNVSVTVIAKDLSETGAPQEIYQELKLKSIPINVLVNNAGFGDYGLFHESAWGKQAMMIDLNVRALTEMTRLFGADMISVGAGKILNVASTAAFQPGPLMAVYYATKAYVWSFSIALANEWKKYGVTVTCLNPGPTESGFQTAADLHESKMVKGKKLATSREVAEFGYKALMGGKTSVIPGFKNKLLAFGAKISPGNMSAAIARNMQAPKNQ